MQTVDAPMVTQVTHIFWTDAKVSICSFFILSLFFLCVHHCMHLLSFYKSSLDVIII